MGWTAGLRFPAGSGLFFFGHRVQTVSGVHPAPYPMVTGGSFTGREADHSYLCSAGVTNAFAIPPFSPMS